MKNFLKYAVSCLALGALLAGCSDWVESERVITQHPDEQSPILRDNAYYAALRDWKRNTKHKIAFGWYGSWTLRTRPVWRAPPIRWTSSRSGASGIR